MLSGTVHQLHTTDTDTRIRIHCVRRSSHPFWDRKHLKKVGALRWQHPYPVTQPNAFPSPHIRAQRSSLHTRRSSHPCTSFKSSNMWGDVLGTAFRSPFTSPFRCPVSGDKITGNFTASCENFFLIARSLLVALRLSFLSLSSHRRPRPCNQRATTEQRRRRPCRRK
jgi:hypothetical protein